MNREIKRVSARRHRVAQEQLPLFSIGVGVLRLMTFIVTFGRNTDSETLERSVTITVWAPVVTLLAHGHEQGTGLEDLNAVHVRSSN